MEDKRKRLTQLMNFVTSIQTELEDQGSISGCRASQIAKDCGQARRWIVEIYNQTDENTTAEKEKPLRIKKLRCKHCGWEGWEDELKVYETNGGTYYSGCPDCEQETEFKIIEGDKK